MNNIQYTKYLFDSVNKISFANPGVIRDTYGKGENLTHDFLIKEANKSLKDTPKKLQTCALTDDFFPEIK